MSNVKKEDLIDSIDKVFQSYGHIRNEDEVLIQPMLKNVIYAGVVFSHDPNNGEPYRIINWSSGNDTSIVTSGKGGEIWQKAANSKINAKKDHDSVIELLEELLLITGNKP